jgi:alpha-L-fucosidase
MAKSACRGPQPWNAANLGPRRGVVEGWKAAAEREGMRFGLAFHGDYALWWFQVFTRQSSTNVRETVG